MPRECPECGEELRPRDGDECPFCGALLDDDRPRGHRRSLPRDRPQKRKSKTVLCGLAGAGVGLLLSGPGVIGAIQKGAAYALGYVGAGVVIGFVVGVMIGCFIDYSGNRR